jgi:exopolysaccharide biosynthesis predicted pyruvyltransferase EpsI
MPDIVAPPTETGDGMLDRLRDAVEAAVASVLAGHPSVALVAFPNQWNLGDTAIWAGQLSALDRVGARVGYACDFRTYRRDELRHAVPEGPILLSGGGNFGDVYPNEQGLRERILDDFPERTVIQLPQSVWFRSETALEAMRRRCEGSGRFALMVRDRRSLELARARFAVPVHLVPDMALALRDIRRRRTPPTAEIMWLLRRDSEAADRALRRAVVQEGPGPVCDWTRPGFRRSPAIWAGYAHGCCLSWLLRTPQGRRRDSEVRIRRRFEALTRLRMELAFRILSEGRVLVTDRLHGHILALLLGVPHVCLDNRNGKVREFHATWTAGHPLVRWADSLADARASARELLCRSCGTRSQDGS